MPNNSAATAHAEIRTVLEVAISTQFGFLGLFVSIAAIALHVLGALEIGSTFGLLASGAAAGTIAFARVSSVLRRVDATGRIRQERPAMLAGVTDRTVAL